MSDNDHDWIKQGQALGINMDADEMNRRLIRMSPAARQSWLYQFEQTVVADESPLFKKAQLEKRLRDLKRVNLELISMGR